MLKASMCGSKGCLKANVSVVDVGFHLVYCLTIVTLPFPVHVPRFEYEEHIAVLM